MPRLVSYLVLGADSVVIIVALCLLLTVFTMSPRATPTLIVWGRAWRLSVTALIVVLAGGLGLVVPVLYVSGVAPPEHAAPADRHGAPTQARHASHDDQGRAGTGGAVALDQPGPLESGATPPFPPDTPVDLSGEWTVTNTVVETSYPPYRQLRLSFRLHLQHQGQAFSGAGEKYLEAGHPIPSTARSPIHIQGTIAEGSVIHAVFQEAGRSRPSSGQFRLTVADQQHLTGTFHSSAANTSGISQWLRSSSRPLAPAPMRAQSRLEGRVRPLPPDQDAPPEIALVAPVQGQGVTTAQVQVRGTATSALGIVQVDVQVNGEPRVQRLVPGTATVDFSEPIALRPGPNDILVTAFDPQHRAARQRVTMTRVEERPQAPAPADEPREPASAGRSTVREHRPGLHLGMSQTEVRHLLGAPVSVEATSKFVFWHYGPEQYVVFEQTTGRVHGWVGVSS